MSYSCPSLPTTKERVIKHPYACDDHRHPIEAPAYIYTNVKLHRRRDLPPPDPYAHMESFIPTISAESLPWRQIGEEKLARVARLSQNRRASLMIARENFQERLQRAVRRVRDRLILPSQVQARFPKRCSTCDREPVYYL